MPATPGEEILDVLKDTALPDSPAETRFNEQFARIVREAGGWLSSQPRTETPANIAWDFWP